MSDQNEIKAVLSLTDQTKPAFDSILASFSQLIRNVNATGSSFDQMFNSVKSNFASWGLVSGITAIAATLEKLTMRTAEMGDHWEKMSQKIGIGVEALDIFSKAAKLSDTDMETLSKGIGIFSKNLQTGDDETGNFARAVQSIGLNFNELRAMKPEDAIKAIAEKFEQFQDGAGKTAVAMTLFGRSGKELIPFLNNLKENMQGMNAAFSPEQAKNAEQFNDNFKRMKISVSDLSNSIGNSLIPAINNMFAALGKSDLKSNLYSKMAAIDDQIKLIEKPSILGIELPFLKPQPGSISAAQLDKLKKERMDIAQQLLDLQSSKTSDSDKKPLNFAPAPIDTAKDINQAARAAIDARLKIELEGLKIMEELQATDAKTREKELEEQYDAGLIGEKEYIDKKNQMQKDALDLGIQYLEEEKKSIAQATADKSGLYGYEQQKVKIKEVGEAEAQQLKRDVEISKQRAAMNQLAIEGNIQNIDYARQYSAAERAGVLTVLEAEMNYRKQLNTLAVERGDMTDLKAQELSLEYDKEILQTKLTNKQLDLESAKTDAQKLQDQADILVLKKQILGVDAQIQRVNEQQNGSLVDGFTQAWKKALNDMGNQFQQGIDLAKQTAQAMQSAFSDFFFDAMQGKLKKLGDYLTSFLSSIQRAIANYLSNSLISALFGSNNSTGLISSAFKFVGSLFADGGIMTSQGAIPLNRYAGGGVAFRPQLAMFGEGSTPEAYVPLPDGRSIPVTMKGNAGQSQSQPQEVHNHYYINAVDAASFHDLVKRNPDAIISTLAKDVRGAGKMVDVIRGAGW